MPELDLRISIIEDPYESFALMSAGQLDVTSSTVEYGPIAVDKKVPIKLVTYTNPSYGTDKIILAPGIESAEQLRGKKIAVMSGQQHSEQPAPERLLACLYRHCSTPLSTLNVFSNADRETRPSAGRGTPGRRAARADR